MANGRKKRTSNFFEAIGAAKAPFEHAQLPQLPKIDPGTKRRILNDLDALGSDLDIWLRHIGRAFASLPAKMIYLIALLIVVGGSTATAVAVAVTTMQQYHNDISNPAIIMNKKNTGTTIVDRNGEVLFQGYGAVTKHNISLDEIPPQMKEATLATEDPDFYRHPGFSWKGTARAMYQDAVHSGKIQGGSTITQQLVKNTLLTSEKSFTRKYKEILLSIELERRYSKDQILQMYLNSIYYGQGAYGIESASETYFHKPAKDLTLEESALLAGLPQSPSLYDPNVSLKAATDRRNYVLDRMEQLKYIDKEQADQTEKKPVQAGTRQVVLKAPHFVFYVMDQLRQKYGEDMVEHGGITVRTTLDLSKQQAAESIVANQVTKLAPHHASNGALISLDPRTGEIISMVGSADYNQPDYGAVNVTLSQLQPGSSFKPIAYATAFEKGWNGATLVQDKPIRLPSGDGGVYAPQDYDQKWRGPVTLRRALANSLNIPAIEVLQYAGIPQTIDMAHTLGIEPPSLTQTNRYGLSLVLGGGEVRPIDMAAVYGTLANQGKAVTPTAISSVSDRFGQDITKKDPSQPKQLIDPRIAYMLTNILSDNQARSEEFGPNSPLKLSRPSAAKTGTTNDFRDNWTVGYTPELVTAVWVGNNDHTPMVNVDGITGAAPIWHDYMETATAGTPASTFPIPPGVVFAKVCPQDGGLVDDNDPKGVTEVFLAEAKQTKRCGWSGASTPKPKSDNPNDNSKPDNKQPDSTATNPQPTPQPGQGSGSQQPDNNPPDQNQPPGNNRAGRPPQT